MENRSEFDIVEIQPEEYNQSRIARSNIDCVNLQNDGQNEEIKEASSERSEQANEETWVVCFEYFTENTVALRWGHIFHEECFVQFTRARRHPCCPNCRMSYSKNLFSNKVGDESSRIWKR